MQLAKAVLLAGELEFDGQALHVEFSEGPTAAEYVPAQQTVHRADPGDDLYFPAAHAVQMPPSGPDEPALQEQFVKSALPAGEMEFDGQALHVELAEAPTAVEYAPVPQSVHRADPVDTLYFPATHAVQVPPSGPEKPALQLQTLDVLLPAGESESAIHARHADAPASAEYVPSLHSLQSVEPLSLLYLPAPHAVHAPPSCPHQPALQAQLLKAVLCAPELDSAGQLLQLASPAALYLPATHAAHAPPFIPEKPALHLQAPDVLLPAGEFEFAAHWLQFADPLSFLYFPAKHNAQGPPSGPEKPALHLHAPCTPDDLGELDPHGQVLQVLDAVLEYVLFMQSLHTADPAVSLNQPAVHAMQAPPFGPE